MTVSAKNSNHLSTTIDNLLADLNDCIYELREDEELQNSLPTPSVEQNQNNLLKPTSFHYNQHKNNSQTDKTLKTISSLPDSIGGSLQKLTTNFLNSQKKISVFLVLTSKNLYLFNSDLPTSEYNNNYPINKNSNIRVSEKGTFVIEFYTEWRSNTDEITRKTIEFQCADSDEMMVWIGCFKEYIEKAKNDFSMSAPPSPISSVRSSRRSLSSNHRSSQNSRELSVERQQLYTQQLQYYPSSEAQQNVFSATDANGYLMSRRSSNTGSYHSQASHNFSDDGTGSNYSRGINSARRPSYSGSSNMEEFIRNKNPSSIASDPRDSGFRSSGVPSPKSDSQLFYIDEEKSSNSKLNFLKKKKKEEDNMFAQNKKEYENLKKVEKKRQKEQKKLAKHEEVAALSTDLLGMF
ncbi:hypothetical protein HK099_008481 [Clydaea vesicula]|uniref:PH domain-containing protein n=1 Tax=Clydaea vesicula TaxID=447962 RepID=A0AAD5TVB2_9FUNG|nr:hypothetical protein HK099_008481 [Clydaea vesicula]